MAQESTGGVELIRPQEGTSYVHKSPLDAFISTLPELFPRAPRRFLLAADSVGEARLGPLFEAYPDRCRNLGAAERNLLGVAAGMAAVGKVVIAVLPGASAASRAGDILRNIVARGGLNVIVAALPAGIEGRAGSSSQALHDLA